MELNCCGLVVGFWQCLWQVKRRLLPTIQPLQTGREPELGQPKAISGRRAARKMGEDSYDLEGGGDGEMAFSDKSVRRGFIKKVYAIISVQVRPMRKICSSNTFFFPAVTDIWICRGFQPEL